MNNSEKSLDQLYAERDKIVKLREIASTLGGRIKVGDEIITVETLRGLESGLKAEITARISNNSLKIVKDDKRG